MSDPIPAQPKYLAVAEAIESQIHSGLWDGGKMPSVRGIATKHNISVVTASRALQVLRDKGLIQTIERSGCYRVPAPSAERWAFCLHLTSGPWQKATTNILRAGFESLARRMPMHLDFDAVQLPESLTLEEASGIAEHLKQTGINGLFMLPNRTSDEQTRRELLLLQGCQAAGLATVLIERNIRGRRPEDKLDCDLVTLDDLGGGFAAAQHLYQTGRKRVGIVVASPTSSHNDRLAGYLYANYLIRHQDKRLSDSPTVVLNSSGSDDYNLLADQILKSKLDGVICYSDYAAIGLIMELLRRGVKVPQNIGIVGFDNLPIGDLFSQGITTYDYPAERLAEQAVRVMREQIAQPNRSPIRVVIPGELIIRGSSVDLN